MAISVELGPGIRLVAPNRSRKRWRVSQPRRATTSSSIMAMWAAGPPKPRIPSFRKTRANSLRRTRALGFEVMVKNWGRTGVGRDATTDPAPGSGNSYLTSRLPSPLRISLRHPARLLRPPLQGGGRPDWSVGSMYGIGSYRRRSLPAALRGGPWNFALTQPRRRRIRSRVPGQRTASRNSQGTLNPSRGHRFAASRTRLRPQSIRWGANAAPRDSRG